MGPRFEPLVSVIIPCRNAGTRFEACLESVERQSHSQIELIVVDNGSTDSSRAVAERVARASRHRFRIVDCPTPGQNFARRVGLEEATGEYVQWLDADDELSPNKLSEQVAALEANPSAAIAHAAWVIDWRGTPRSARRVYHAPPDLMDPLFHLLADGWYMGPGIVYLERKSLSDRLHAARAWNPDTHVWTDREYFTTAALLGASFVATPHAVARYNQWSNAQASKVDPNARLPVMKTVFARFRDLARTAPPDLIAPRHTRLLEQSWSAFRVDRTVKAGSRMRALGALASIVASEIAQVDVPRSVEWFTNYVRMRAPLLSSSVLAVRDTLEGFVSDGFLLEAET